MHQLMFEAAGEYAWRDAPDPEITAPGQAIVRPVAVACCDLDVAVAEGRLPMPPGHAVGHEGVAEVVAGGGAGCGGRGGGRGVVAVSISCGTFVAGSWGGAGGRWALPVVGVCGLGAAPGPR